jgi:hypothetical protein
MLTLTLTLTPILSLALTLPLTLTLILTRYQSPLNGSSPMATSNKTKKGFDNLKDPERKSPESQFQKPMGFKSPRSLGRDTPVSPNSTVYSVSHQV